MSKSYERKKVYRRQLKALAMKGYINDPSGRMITRSSCPDNSMKAHYFPNR